MTVLRGAAFQTPPILLHGRDAELTQLQRLLGEQRVVTLIGAPGVGKSALASVAARRAVARFKGGVWYCDLAEATNGQVVCTALERALELQPGLAPHEAAPLGPRLRQRDHALILLDGIDLAADAIAALLPAWLGAAPSVQWLLTSRRRLRLRWETTLAVHALSDESGQALFLERAGAVRGSFAPEPATRSALGSITRACGGLPLALELAAQQTASLSLAQLQTGLAQDLSLLERPLRDMPARHHSMRAAIELSFSQLIEPARRLLVRCSVFGSDFTLAAAQCVMEPYGNRSLPVALADLLDHSLLECPQPGGPYHLAPPTRAFARERLAACDDHAGVLARHARLCLTVAEAAEPHPDMSCSGQDLEAIASRWLDPKTAAAITREQAARALCLLAEAPSPPPSLCALLDRVLDGTRALPRTLEARIRIARARQHRYGGRSSAALSDLRAALGLAECADLRAAAYRERGHTHRHNGRPRDARQAYRKALEWAQGPTQQAHTLGSLGALHFEQGELEQAAALHSQALALFQQCGQEAEGAVVFHNAGLIAQERGALVEAERVYERALELHGRNGNQRFEAIAHLDLAGLQLERGLHSAARAEAGMAWEGLEECGDKRHAALAQALRGVASALLGQLSAAQAGFVRAEALRASTGDEVFAQVIEVHRGHLQLAQALRAYANGADAECAAHLRPGDGIGRGSRPRRRTASAQRSRESDELRLAHRLLKDASARYTELGDSLLVANDQTWLRGPGCQRSDLSSKAVARRLLAVLLDQRLTRPEQPVPMEVLLRSGWPDERLLAASASNRLHVALNQLRKLGLTNHLLRRGVGYRLDPELPVLVVEQ